VTGHDGLFWKGAVHIDDVASAVILSVDLISRKQLRQHLVLTLDSAYEYTDADLDHWDADGAGSTFKKYYSEYYDLAISYGLDPVLKPRKPDISETVRWLGYNRLIAWRACYRNWQPTAIADLRNLVSVLNSATLPRTYQDVVLPTSRRRRPAARPCALFTPPSPHQLVATEAQP
jgi:hypothetical protein